MKESTGQEPTTIIRKKNKPIKGQSLTAVINRKRIKALFLAGITALGIGGGAKLSDNICEHEEPKNMDIINADSSLASVSDPTVATLTTDDLLATSEKLNEEVSPFFETVYVPFDKIEAPEVTTKPVDTVTSNPETKKDVKKLVMTPQRNNK